MRHILRIVFRALLIAVLVGVLTLAVTGIPAPPSFVAQDVPRVSWRWAWRSVALVRRLQRQRTFAAWYGADRRMLVTLGTSRVLYAVSAILAPDRLRGDRRTPTYERVKPVDFNTAFSTGPARPYGIAMK